MRSDRTGRRRKPSGDLGASLPGALDALLLRLLEVLPGLPTSSEGDLSLASDLGFDLELLVVLQPGELAGGSGDSASRVQEGEDLDGGRDGVRLPGDALEVALLQEFESPPESHYISRISIRATFSSSCFRSIARKPILYSGFVKK